MTPVLRTDRLVLEPLRPDDHAALLAHWSHPQVRRFLFDDAPPTPEQVTEILAAGDFGRWGLRRAAGDGRLIGTIALHRLEAPEGDPHRGEAEILYTLEPGQWGRGLAAEAAAAVLMYAFEELALPRVVAEIDEGNVASSALAGRLGMRLADTVPGVFGPMGHYVVERSQWLGSRGTAER